MIAATRSIRRGLGGFVLAGAFLLGFQQLSAQAIAKHDSNAPVDFSADRIEMQDKQNRVVLSGNVAIIQAGLRLQAARTTIAYSDEGELKIQRLDATGGVFVTRNDESARGDVAIYDFNRRIITMAGNVTLNRGDSTLNGGRLVIDLATGISSVDGRASGGSSAIGSNVSTGSGRVSGTFAVPKNKDKKKKAD